MQRFSIIALVACLSATVSGKRHHHHETNVTIENMTVEYSSWEGYSAGMMLPNTVAELTNVAKGSCQDGCQNSCYGTFSIGDQCYALFVDPTSNYTLPDGGSISWKFATRECSSGTNFIDFTGACQPCPDGEVTATDGTSCESPADKAATVQRLAGAAADPGHSNGMKARLRHREARRDRVARQKREMGLESIFDAES